MPGLSSFNRRGLYRMKQFYEAYSMDSDCYQLWLNVQTPGSNTIMSTVPTQLQSIDNQHNKFVSSVMTQISWTNHMEILSGTKSAEEKLFYLLITAKEKLTKLELRRQIKTATFERTMLAKQKVSTLRTQLPQNLFKDPYIFEFLDLPDGHSETDLEKALIINLQKFILEIGKGYTYMGNQLKTLLCKGKDTEVVEYAMARNISPALVADYETKLIDKKVLANKLNQLIELFSTDNQE